MLRGRGGCALLSVLRGRFAAPRTKGAAGKRFRANAARFRARCNWFHVNLILSLASIRASRMGLAGLTATASTWAPGSSPGVTEEEGRSGLGDGC